MAASTPPTLVSARIAGAMYLAIIGLGLFGELFVRGALVVAGNPVATADKLLGSELLWRLGIAGDLLMHVLDVPLIVFFYLLLRPVSHPLALLATVFNVVQTSTLVINKLSLLSALSLVEASARTPAAFDARALAFQAIDLHGHGFALGLVFFGMTCLVRGYLIVKSRYVPRLLGLLLVAAGGSYLLNSFALLLSPPLAAKLFPAVLLPAFVGELALTVWLLLADERLLQKRFAVASSAGEAGR